MKNKKGNFGIKLWLAICGIAMSLSSFAQQEVIYSQYMFNTLALNPAYAGSRDVLSVTAVGRYQWLNIDGSPKTHSFSVDMPFKNEKMGIGIIAYNDAIGVANNTGLNIAYSYKLKLGQRSTLALGLQPTISSLSLALSKVDNLINLNDPIFQNDQNRLFFNAGLGLYLSNDKGYVSLSVPQIIEQKIIPSEITSTGKNQRNYFLTMGFVIGKGNFKIKPSTIVRYTKGAPAGIDGNVNFWIKDKISFGLSGRKSQPTFQGIDKLDAVVGLFELQLSPQLRLGYAYDYNMTRINGGGSDLFKKLTGTPSHEWLLRYEFGYGKSKILTPRYF
jgi:type IX secretion system PorP/SprF family membrane protein